MESPENNSFLQNLNRNLSNIHTELDGLNISIPNQFFNISEKSTTENLTNNRQDLYEVPTVVVVVLGLFYGAICITAILGNLLVLCLVLASRQMRTVTNLFIANLALADIIIAMFTIPFQFQAALLQKWNLPHVLCAVCPFVQVLTVTVSVLTLVIIALDRYRAVMYPFKEKLSKKKALGAILAVWIVSFILAFPTELDYSVIKVTKNGRTKDFCANVYLPETFRIYYNQGIVIIQYFLPLFIISKAYFRIGRTLLRSNTPGNQEEVRDALVLRKKEKVIKMLFTVVVTFALCWFPLQTYNFLSVIFPSINSFEYINILWFGFHWLAMSNSCCNPFIYAFYSKKFKTELFNRVPCLARFWPINCARNNAVNDKLNNHINGQIHVNQFKRCNIKVICNPIQSNVNKVNIDKVSEDDSTVSRIEMGINVI